jgi:hypothetical protein
MSLGVSPPVVTQRAGRKRRDLPTHADISIVHVRYRHVRHHTVDLIKAALTALAADKMTSPTPGTAPIKHALSHQLKPYNYPAPAPACAKTSCKLHC